MNSIVRLMLDTNKGIVPTKYAETSKSDREDAIRKAIFEVIGVEKYGTKEYRNAIRRNKAEVYELIEELLNGVIEEGRRAQLDFYQQFVDERILSLGDSPIFEVEAENTLALAKFSGNHWNVARSRVEEGGEFTVSTFDYGIAVYDYLDRFLSGRADLSKLISLMESAIDDGIKEACYATFSNAIGTLPAPFIFNGNYDEIAIMETLGHVEAYNKQLPVLIATRTALAKLQNKVTVKSDNMIDEKNNNGLLEIWNGYRCIPFENIHKKGTFDFAFNDTKILALPASAKLVKLVLEGDTQIKEEDKNADKSKTITATFKMGVGVCYSGLIGTITITN